MYEISRWRQHLAATLIGLGFDAAVAFVAAEYLTDPYTDKGMTFLFVFIGLYLVGFVAWFRRTLRAWVIYWLSPRARRYLSRQIASHWANKGLPTPDVRDYSAESYLQRIAEDESEDPNARVRAALELGSLKQLAQAGHFNEAWRLTMLADDAVEVGKRAQY